MLGLVLTSAGRFEEASAALQRALVMAREQNSPGFEAEALVRQARLLLQWQTTELAGHEQASLKRTGQQRAVLAQAALDAATPLLATSPEPLRVSQLVLAQVQAAHALQRPAPSGALARLQEVASRSTHPLVHVRLAQVQHLLALADGDAKAAAQSASTHAAQMARTARQAGLLEPLAQALLFQAQAQDQAQSQAQAWAQEALALAQRQGFAPVEQAAQAWLHTHPPVPHV